MEEGERSILNPSTNRVSANTWADTCQPSHTDPGLWAGIRLVPSAHPSLKGQRSRDPAPSPQLHPIKTHASCLRHTVSHCPCVSISPRSLWLICSRNEQFSCTLYISPATFAFLGVSQFQVPTNLTFCSSVYPRILRGFCTRVIAFQSS